MSELRIDLDGGRNAFAPGETLAVRVAWHLASPPKRLELRLFWYTEGKGTQDVEIVERHPLEGGAFGEQRVSLRAPSGPYSFSGRLISLLWALEAVAEPGGEVARREIVLSPSGEEVRLDAPGAARDPV